MANHFQLQASSRVNQGFGSGSDTLICALELNFKSCAMCTHAPRSPCFTVGFTIKIQFSGLLLLVRAISIEITIMGGSLFQVHQRYLKKIRMRKVEKYAFYLHRLFGEERETRDVMISTLFLKNAKRMAVFAVIPKMAMLL